MNDSDLIEVIAVVWMVNGGDEDSFLRCQQEIFKVIEKKRIEISESLARKRAKILEAIDE